MTTITTAAYSSARDMLGLPAGAPVTITPLQRKPGPGELWYVNDIIGGGNVRGDMGSPPSRARAFTIQAGA